MSSCERTSTWRQRTEARARRAAGCRASLAPSHATAAGGQRAGARVRDVRPRRLQPRGAALRAAGALGRRAEPAGARTSLCLLFVRLSYAGCALQDLTDKRWTLQHATGHEAAAASRAGGQECTADELADALGGLQPVGEGADAEEEESSSDEELEEGWERVGGRGSNRRR